MLSPTVLSRLDLAASDRSLYGYGTGPAARRSVRHQFAYVVGIWKSQKQTSATA